MKHAKPSAPLAHAPYPHNPPPQPLPLRKGEGLTAAPAPRGGQVPPPLRGEGVRGWGFRKPHSSIWPGQRHLAFDGAKKKVNLHEGRRARGVGFTARAIAPRPHAPYPHNPPPQPLPLRKGEGLTATLAPRGGQGPPPLRGEGVRGWGLSLLPAVLTGWGAGVAWLLLGALAGLGLSALADVLPHGPRAARRCPRCGAMRSWQAYALNLRPCPHCGWRAWRPWVLIVLTAGLTVFLRFTPTRVPFAWLWPLTLGFLLIAVIDWEHHLILPEVLALVGLYGLALGVVRRGWGNTLLGMVMGGLIMLVLYALGRWLQPRLGAAEEPLGFGDVLLMLVLGAVLGWPGVLAGWVWGVLLAGAYSVVLLAVCALRGRGWAGGVFLPYAPFLLLAAWGLLVGW